MPDTLRIHTEPPPARPLFPTTAYYAEVAREALEIFGLAVQLPIPGLAGHRPNLPGIPLADAVAYLRSGMTRYTTVSDDKFQGMFDWEHNDAFYPEHQEKQALEWTDGLIGGEGLAGVLVGHFSPESCAFGHERRNHCVFRVPGYPDGRR